MLERLVGFALSQRLFVALSVLLLIGAGFVVLPSLPIDAFPDVSPVQVKIIMKAPGLTPEEVEQRITVPIELELLGLPNKKILRSSTKYALADITVDFDDGTDIYWARNQVTERLSNIARDLPEGVSGGLAPITSPLGEMFMFTIDSPELSLAERRTLLDWVIRPALRTVPGVADVNALGGYVRAFEIVPLNDALAARGIRLNCFAARWRPTAATMAPAVSTRAKTAPWSESRVAFAPSTTFARSWSTPATASRSGSTTSRESRSAR